MGRTVSVHHHTINVDIFQITFQFDFSIFNDTAMPEKGEGKKSKYPLITPDFQSQNVPRLWFGKLEINKLRHNSCRRTHLCSNFFIVM